MKLIDAIICALRLKNGSDTLEGYGVDVFAGYDLKRLSPVGLSAEVGQPYDP